MKNSCKGPIFGWDLMISTFGSHRASTCWFPCTFNRAGENKLKHNEETRQMFIGGDSIYFEVEEYEVFQLFYKWLIDSHVFYILYAFFDLAIFDSQTHENNSLKTHIFLSQIALQSPFSSFKILLSTKKIIIEWLLINNNEQTKDIHNPPTNPPPHHHQKTKLHGPPDHPSLKWHPPVPQPRGRHQPTSLFPRTLPIIPPQLHHFLPIAAQKHPDQLPPWLPQTLALSLWGHILPALLASGLQAP